MADNEMFRISQAVPKIAVALESIAVELRLIRMALQGQEPKQQGPAEAEGEKLG